MVNKLNIFSDHRGGYLIPFEFMDLPFSPKRIFTITDVPKDEIRGDHAHYETQQILICIKGEIMVYLDYGYKHEEILLRKGEHVFVDKMIWDSQKFLTGDDFMVVISSTHYDINDYITNKEEFYKKIISEK
jgi:hypothetical protein